MDLDQLKRVLELVRTHDVRELEVESEGLRLRVKTDPAAGRPAAGANAVASEVAAGVPPAQAAAELVPVPAPAPLASPPAVPVAAPAPPTDAADLEFVNSPIVGTFYRAPEPGAKPFVDVGQRVRRGQVLCIIEAMKLMNEIESEYAGEIVNIFVENAQAVQYGERLFAIRKG